MPLEHESRGFLLRQPAYLKQKQDDNDRGGGDDDDDDIKGVRIGFDLHHLPLKL